MCPVCVANATLAAVSAISAGGLSAFAGRKLFLKTERNDQTNETGGEKMKIETMEPKTNTSELNPSKVVSRDEWLIARKDLLTREKELTRLRDEVSRHRRELPWVKIDKEYVFDGPRDVTFVVVSRALLSEIEPFKKRMGWRFKWVSSHGNDFNFDYHVSATGEEKAKGKMYYNYKTQELMSDELPGLSVFYKDENGDVYHTYSTYARGLDILVGAYNFLDLVPKGRDEDPDSTMNWVCHHDRY